MAAIENMTRSEMRDYILDTIGELWSAGYGKSAGELENDLAAANSSAELMQTAYDAEDLSRQLHAVLYPV